MATASAYQQLLRNNGLLKMEASASGVGEARLLKKQIIAKQKRLRQVKRDINLDMKVVRASYRQKVAEAGSAGSMVFTLFGKRRLAGQWRAAAKADQRSGRDVALAQYEDVKAQIDEALLQMDEAKIQIDSFIAKLKLEGAQ